MAVPWIREIEIAYPNNVYEARHDDRWEFVFSRQCSGGGMACLV